MKIRSSKSLLFRGDVENVIIRKNDIKDVPDWVAKTDTFNLAKKDESILVIVTKEDKKKAENEEKLESSTNKNK